MYAGQTNSYKYISLYVAQEFESTTSACLNASGFL